jgi:plastocyanin
MQSAAVLLAVLGLTAGCGDTSQAPTAQPARCEQAEGGRAVIVAEDLLWMPDCVGAPAGELTIVVDNRDVGVNHNIHLPDAPGEPATPLEAGPVTQELTVSLEPGDYRYICDLHADMMGRLRVTDANSP